jgi:hypothetical protein
MKTRRRSLRATTSLLLLSLGAGTASASSSAWENDGAAKRLAEIAGKASADRRALTELYRMQDEYVDRAAREWRDGAERKKLQDATGLLQTNTDRINASLRMVTEAAESLSARMGRSGLLERMALLETALKDAEARLAARWELERVAQAREREQREREAGERARAQRR